jgi:glycosyltransferase involved in cell wall biosynthesis
MNKLSVLIVACDEEELLPAALQHARAIGDEVVVVVQQSEDRTLEIALEGADIVLEQPRMGSCEFSRREGMAACTGDWVLQLDADENLSAFGQVVLRDLLTNPEPVVYALRRLTTVDGALLEDAMQYRLIRPEDWDGVHNLMHSSLHPREGVRIVGVGGPPFIEHFKTSEKQQRDWARYAKWGYLKTEVRPELAEVAWTIKRK